MVTYCGVHGGGFWCGECKDMNIVMASIGICISNDSFSGMHDYSCGEVLVIPLINLSLVFFHQATHIYLTACLTACPCSAQPDQK